ncbi:MAG: exosortase K [Lachnospiraceae bacterium]|nr:exosortase K [Lachnospiraceae bacterium]
MYTHRKNFWRTHGFTCLTGLLLLFALKLYYSRTDCDGLLWILAPTAWWIHTLSGISFEYLPHAGYVNHSFRFVIAASCSGIQFWIVSTALLLFSFLPRIRGQKEGLGWLGISFTVSYIFTILVNGFRILLSLYLPLYLSDIHKYHHLSRWITPERLHTMIGIAVYFGSLLVLFFVIEALFQGTDHSFSYLLLKQNPLLTTHMRWLLPAFWYFAVVLGLPLLNRAYQHNRQSFTEYALTILSVCLPMSLLFWLVSKAFIWKKRS